MITLLLFYFAFGLIVGSFLNVVILRHGTGRSILGRSTCATCGKVLAWYELVPVFSWLFLGAHCRRCHASISAQYPFVELFTGFMFMVVAFSGLSPLLLITAFAVVSLLIAITIYDLKHTVIPDSWVFGFMVCALTFAALEVPFMKAIPTLLVSHTGAGIAFALPFASLWAVSKGRWIGLGDAKLIAGIGFLLGWALGLSAVMGAFILGAFVSVCVLMPLPNTIRVLSLVGITRLESRASEFTMKSEIPFGPFLIVTCLLIWILHLYGIQLYLYDLGAVRDMFAALSNH